MIGKLTGTVDYKASDYVLLDVNGVGYQVYCNERVMATLPGKGGMVALYTELLVREDLLQLFGFATLVEREWHRLLTSVQGVGAKAALAVLGTLGPEATGRAILLGDAAAIKAAPGIGPKIAQRIVNELTGKAPQVMAMGGAVAEPAAAPLAVNTPAEQMSPGAAPSAEAASAAPPAAASEALSALVNLGYGQGEAASAIARVQSEGDETGALIRKALKALAPEA